MVADGVGVEVVVAGALRIPVGRARFANGNGPALAILLALSSPLLDWGMCPIMHLPQAAPSAEAIDLRTSRQANPAIARS